MKYKVREGLSGFFSKHIPFWPMYEGTALIGRPYFYTRKSPNFAFSSSFFISIYLYLRSRDHRIAYTDHTPTISAEHSPTYPADLQRLTESFRAYPFLIISPSQPRDITEHH